MGFFGSIFNKAKSMFGKVSHTASVRHCKHLRSSLIHCIPYLQSTPVLRVVALPQVLVLKVCLGTSIGNQSLIAIIEGHILRFLLGPGIPQPHVVNVIGRVDAGQRRARRGLEGMDESAPRVERAHALGRLARGASRRLRAVDVRRRNTRSRA